MSNLFTINREARAKEIIRLHEEGIPEITCQHITSAGQGIQAACREILADHKTRYPHLYS